MTDKQETRLTDAVLIATSKLDATERVLALATSALRSIVNNIGVPVTETEQSILRVAEKALTNLGRSE